MLQCVLLFCVVEMATLAVYRSLCHRLQSSVYLASFAQTIHSLVVGKTSETDAIHLQQSVTYRRKTMRHSKESFIFPCLWVFFS